MPYSTIEHNNPATAQNSAILQPDGQSPGTESSAVQSPAVQNSGAQSSAVQNPGVQSPSVQSLGVQSNSYQNELQQQRLRRLASELAAITDPNAKLQFIEQRLLDNLQQLKRQLAILQLELPQTADKTKPGP
ncbi:hypothetical protein [Rheinheimera sp.]|uniref:hypothetical protein n=1 Tax=Rheinheimera sp. TaxID=1869214 RepID=UPI0027B99A9E|nr:hypothetical protein [Rheinheimera sp.]